MKYKDIIVFLGSAFFIVIAWVVFNIYHNSVVSTTSDDLTKGTAPINPNFDESAIDKLKNRIKISPIYGLATPSSLDSTNVTPEIPPEITTEPEGSASALVASEGGKILQ